MSNGFLTLPADGHPSCFNPFTSSLITASRNDSASARVVTPSKLLILLNNSYPQVSPPCSLSCRTARSNLSCILTLLVSSSDTVYCSYCGFRSKFPLLDGSCLFHCLLQFRCVALTRRYNHDPNRSRKDNQVLISCLLPESLISSCGQFGV